MHDNLDQFSYMNREHILQLEKLELLEPATRLGRERWIRPGRPLAAGDGTELGKVVPTPWRASSGCQCSIRVAPSPAACTGPGAPSPCWPPSTRQRSARRMPESPAAWAVEAALANL
jgi:hypothetical protein